MSENKHRRAPSHMGVGVASIVMIFTVLCLTALGVLALSSARSKARLSDKRAEYVMAYYEAEAQAQRQLALFDGACASGAAPEGDVLDVQIQIFDDVQLIIRLEANADSTARISSHTIVNTTQWDLGESLLFP